ncbi:MAG: phosphocholine cytidylyltransferase family protein [Deltaproteobacteria bacterium]|jgi:choline kinase|nr:phosphocholine cytidylyltransferase family protein [Deltaproteobacteria bacterium]MBW2533975.1 phosphocholine cytidylyltransferase family protein [Deltaproteobacteria bacterium]
MRAILLAAGGATRLRPLTETTPKCLLDIGARTMLSRTLSLFVERGIRRFTIVDGFYGEKIRDAVTSEFDPSWFRFVRNERWDCTNNAYSLWLAREEDREPFMLIDSDVLFDPEVLDRVLQSDAPNRLALRTAGGVGAEEMKVKLDEAGHVVDISKEIAPAEANGESVGIEVFSPGFSKKLFATLERRMVTEERVNEYYEASFAELARAGEPIQGVDLGDLRSMEVDTIEDLEKARADFG